jgi:transcription antitermination factor NusG
MQEIESFLPTYETIRVWKNRQRMNLILPLFPTYLFVHINSSERAMALQSPGVLQIMGNNRECFPVPDAEVEFRAPTSVGGGSNCIATLLLVKVHIKSGVMQGVRGNSCEKEQPHAVRADAQIDSPGCCHSGGG